MPQFASNVNNLNPNLAGIRTEKLLGSKTSVYVGCMSAEYATLSAKDPESLAKYQATGTGAAMLSNRLSWFYDLRGPSLTLDTACSSSLNALHIACQGLRTGESTMVVFSSTFQDCRRARLTNY